MRITTKNSGLGFQGQIVTKKYDDLTQYALTCELDKAHQLALQIFVEFLKYKKTKRIIRYHSSYGLKHLAEQISRKLVKDYPGYQYEYIGNEDMIFAMLRAGFICRNCGDYEGNKNLSPNYYFNVGRLKMSNWIKSPILDKIIKDTMTSDLLKQHTL